MKTISRGEFEKQNVFGTEMIFHFSNASFGITDYL